jgi:uncharacterized damage-inducible protein DinB
MRWVDGLVSELDFEVANTRKVLERVPEAKLGWKPHEKSWSLGELATHVANLPGWLPVTLQQESLDASTVPTPTVAGSTEELLQTFDTKVREAREALRQADDKQLFASWSLLMQGKHMFTMPRMAVLRNFILNHSIHHRAQLGVYLRLLDVAVPSVYGPSADEGNR